jgi:hypothetical protein
MIKTPPCGLKPSGDRPTFVLFVSFVVKKQTERDTSSTQKPEELNE